MIKEVHTIQGSFEDYILLAKDYDLTQMPDIRFIPLFGANGVGKTTLLKALNGQVTRQFLKKKKKALPPLRRILTKKLKSWTKTLRKQKISLTICLSS